MPEKYAYTAVEGRDSLNALMAEIGSQRLTQLDRQPLNADKTRWLLPLRASATRIVCVIEGEGVAGWVDLEATGNMGAWQWRHNPNGSTWNVGDEVAVETVATWDLAHFGNDVSALMSALATVLKRLTD